MSQAPNPREAREAYLNGLPADEQALVLRQSEKVGPLPDDADWLVVRASQQAAAQISKAVDRLVSMDPDAVAGSISATVTAAMVAQIQEAEKVINDATRKRADAAVKRANVAMKMHEFFLPVVLLGVIVLAVVALLGRPAELRQSYNAGIRDQQKFDAKYYDFSKRHGGPR